MYKEPKETVKAAEEGAIFGIGEFLLVSANRIAIHRIVSDLVRVIGLRWVNWRHSRQYPR